MHKLDSPLSFDLLLRQISAGNGYPNSVNDYNFSENNSTIHASDPLKHLNPNGHIGGWVSNFIYWYWMSSVYSNQSCFAFIPVETNLFIKCFEKTRLHITLKSLIHRSCNAAARELKSILKVSQTIFITLASFSFTQLSFFIWHLEKLFLTIRHESCYNF